MLLLLTVIAVAFLSLSTLTVKSARSDWALEEARSNARLALMIAIGELQRDLGPDQAVSANAAIMDQSPETSDIDQVEEPYWVGVWKTTWDSEGDSNTDRRVSTPWVRDDNKGGLRDLRNEDGYNRQDAVRNYFVSGNEGGKREGQNSSSQFLDAVSDGVTQLDAEDRLKLVSTNSVNDVEDEVNVKKTNTLKYVRLANGQRAAVETGSYGYWVGDLGVRANVTATDIHIDKRPKVNEADDFERILYAQDHEMGLIDGFSTLDEDTAEKVLSPSMLEFTGVSEDDLKDNFHNLTSSSYSVLANVRDGGLQKDLHAYINLPSQQDDIEDLVSNAPLHYVGLSDDDQLVGVQNSKVAGLVGAQSENRFEVTSPRFGIMRKWIQDAATFDFDLGHNDLDLQDRQEKELLPEIDTMRADRGTVFDGLLGGIDTRPSSDPVSRVPRGGGVEGRRNEPMKIKRLDHPSIAPIITEASLYYNIAELKTQRTVPNSNPERREDYYQLYMCTYPRVAIWNPYNVDMELPPMIVQIFVNGNKRVRMEFEGTSRTIAIPFGKRFGGTDDATAKILPFAGGLGQTFWYLANSQDGDKVTIPPGKTVVFTPDVNGSRRGNGNYSSSDFTNNLLTPRFRPSPQRFYWEEILKGNHSGGGGNFTRIRTLDTKRAFSYFEDVGRGRGTKDTGADNAQFIVKYDDSGRRTQGQGIIQFAEDWDVLTYANVSLQLGGSDELPLRTRRDDPGFVHATSRGNGGISGRLSRGVAGQRNFTPRDFTRDGYRLRWFDETGSNTAGSGRLGEDDMAKLFATAPIANWNMRMTFSARNPLDNLSDIAPYFFGVYTRDLQSGESGFEAMQTRGRGLQLGYPFSSPNTAPGGAEDLILFELPNENIGIPSLAYLRHLKLSELAWHPTYAIGNSLVDPKIDPAMTTMDRSKSIFEEKGGWNFETIGFNRDRTRSGSQAVKEDYWASLLREALQLIPEESHLLYDMSYETNYNLWDTYFISSGDEMEKGRFAQVNDPQPLPDGKLQAYGNRETLLESISGKEAFFRAASQLIMKGGFNVHSTSKEAWMAVLGSTRGVGLGGGNDQASFPRFLNPVGRSNDSSVNVDEQAMTGNRVLDDREIEELAERIVEQVKMRAPFFGLADFVNRRLMTVDEDADSDSDTVRMARAGAIEEALAETQINDEFNEGSYSTERERGNIETRNSFDSIQDPTRLDHRMKPQSKLWGFPGYMTQGDILSSIGSGLRARSDTFIVRAYGDAKDARGKITARAWCEATIQRTPEPINPDTSVGLNPEILGNDTVDFGRRFKIVAFRWLNADEV